MKILLIEDNFADRLLTQKAFSKTSGECELFCVDEGQSALQYLLSQPEDSLPNVVLSDMHLPDMTGHEILGSVKEHKHLRDIPFVVLSSSSSQQEIDLSFELGANSHVFKPNSMRAFYAFAEAILLASQKTPFALDVLYEAHHHTGAA